MYVSATAYRYQQWSQHVTTHAHQQGPAAGAVDHQKTVGICKLLFGSSRERIKPKLWCLCEFLQGTDTVWVQ